MRIKRSCIVMLLCCIIFQLIMQPSKVMAKELGKNIISEKEVYRKIKKQPKKLNYSINEYDINIQKEDYVNNMSILNEMEYLVPKTNNEYEVILAYEDGEFSYVDSMNTIEEAINYANNIYSKELKSKSILPSVLYKNGTIVYSVNSMGRIRKIVNGEPYNGTDKVTYIYPNKDMSGTSNYVHQGYVSDVPIIEDNGSNAKIQISGYTGWISKDTTSKEYDLVVVPMNQVKNPSYFEVINGELYHWISSDITDESKSKGYKRVVCKAPNYLREGIKYYSYDMNYFYTDLNILISDLKQGTNARAINNSQPYYMYYMNLPFRSKTNITASELDMFILNNTNYDSKLRNTGNMFIKAQEQYGVNALLMLGVAINESSWGNSKLAKTKNNLFGLGAVDSNPNDAMAYESIEQCINEFAKYWISKGYADPQDWRFNGGNLGDKSIGTNVKYASDPYWGEKAASFAYIIDKGVSGSISSLKDFNFYEIGILTNTGKVKSAEKSDLYTIIDKKHSNSSFIGTRVVLNSNTKYSTPNAQWYGINPDRTTYLSLNSGVEFNGLYDWDKKGFIKSDNVRVINASSFEGIMYQSHVQDIGWQNWTTNGNTSGTVGKCLKVEGVRIKLSNMPVGTTIKYRGHVQDVGWQEWKYEGQLSGTTGQNKKVEAIQIEEVNFPSDKKILYRAHVENEGWQPWKTSGEVAGTTGQNKRVEAIEVKIVDKEDDLQIKYKSHVSDIGWQDYKMNGEIAGTTGQAKKMEAIDISLIGNLQSIGIKYSAHVQDIGWQSWVGSGEVAGTVGKAKQVEALKIELVGASRNVHIEYRVHVSDIGWQDWVRDGDIAGTVGKNKAIEAIQIRIING